MNPGLPERIYHQISKIDIRNKPQQYCHSVLNVICANLGYRFGSIILVDDEGKGHIFSAYNLPPTYPDEVKQVKVPVLSSPSGEVIDSGRTVVVNEIESDPRLKPWHSLLKKNDIKTVIWIPLTRGDITFGTYNLYHICKKDVTQHEINLLNQLGVLLSIAIISNEYIDEISEKSDKLKREIAVRKKVESELRIAKDNAEAASRAKTEFLSNMSHEIRTPMNAILGFSNILKEEEQDLSRKEALEMIHDAGLNLMGIINDILELANIESGRVEIENIEFSISKVLAELKRSFHEQSVERNLLFTVAVDSSVPNVLVGDRHKISKIVTNIIKNAFKFTSEGQITVECQYDYSEQLATIIVSDTGIGISENKQQIIFEAFIQGDGSTTRQFGGIGLGLTIASKLANLLGGEVTLNSVVGEGSDFYIGLPLKMK